MRRWSLIFVAFLLCAPPSFAQRARVLRQHDMRRWGIPAGNYSGITPLGEGRYALVSDKQPSDGYTEVRIDFSDDGDVRSMTFLGHHYAPQREGRQGRDAEGIVATNEGTFFVCAEDDQGIVEIDAHGEATGRKLAVPVAFGVDSIFPNYGFEALAYDNSDGKFWTTTEQGLRFDAVVPTSFDNPVRSCIALLRSTALFNPLRNMPIALKSLRLLGMWGKTICALEPTLLAFPN